MLLHRRDDANERVIFESERRTESWWPVLLEAWKFHPKSEESIKRCEGAAGDIYSMVIACVVQGPSLIGPGALSHWALIS